MVNVFLNKLYIPLLLLIVFTISKSSDIHMNSSKKNINHNLLINKNENKSIQYKSFSSTNDSWLSNLIKNHLELFILGIIGIIVLILVIIIIVCLLRLKSKYKDLNTQISKVSFKTDDKRDTIDDDDLLE